MFLDVLISAVLSNFTVRYLVHVQCMHA